MPFIRLLTPSGYTFYISTRDRSLLEKWFDEVLPHAFMAGRPGIDDFVTLWPRVEVMPMWAWGSGPPTKPDWACDARVLGQLHELPARTGKRALELLDEISSQLERELVELRRQP